MNHWLLVCGLLASPLYVGTIVLGGALHPGYSHLSSSISDLTALGAPYKTLLDVLFLVDYLLLVLFAIGLLQMTLNGQWGRRNGLFCAAALIVSGVCGALVQLLFPQNGGGLQTLNTPMGGLHLVFSSVAALSAAFATLFGAFWFSEQRGWDGFSRYSLVTFALMFVTGGAVLLAAFIWFPFFGLIERTTLGAFVLWIFLVALKLTKG